jgi:UDP:flavonoid glycosyltransferase YjiC (YdhE family)
MQSERIVLTTFGSLGDLHPFIAIALGLKARGHDAVLATGESYRRKVEALGLGFRAVRPDSAIVADPVAMQRFMDLRWGTVRVLRDFIVPSITGFPLYDRDSEARLPRDVARFLDDGPPPIVFTLGASAAMVAGPFFDESLAAAKTLGRRAVLIAGKDQPYHPASLPHGMAAFDYAPFSELFPRACAVVHAGGIGTTGLAMRSGRPMLVVPHAHDQPENARRLVRLGIARTVSRRRYRSACVTAELEQLLGDPAYADRASQVGEPIRDEDGAQAACNALEKFLSI